MSLKIFILVAALFGILVLVALGGNIKDIALNGMTDAVPDYNCAKGELCTSCTINGSHCSCGEHVCNCGNLTVNKTACSLF